MPGGREEKKIHLRRRKRMIVKIVRMMMRERRVAMRIGGVARIARGLLIHRGDCFHFQQPL